jgi:hypothetical protein
MELLWHLLASRASVPVHVVASEVVVVNTDGLPLPVHKQKQDDRVPLDRAARLTEPNDDALSNRKVDVPLVGNGLSVAA